jgi:C4-dicarboxylate-specific signal transduction histidine kinase
MNLMLNAADAMGAVDPESRLLAISTAQEDSKHLRVALRDSGIGFAPDSAEKLFEPFFTTKESGMGFGLTLCRSIIRAHGGRLWAENNQDGGASFYFTIPIHSESPL